MYVHIEDSCGRAAPLNLTWEAWRPQRCIPATGWPQTHSGYLGQIGASYTVAENLVVGGALGFGGFTTDMAG